MSDKVPLVIIVPTRSRPGSVPLVVEAWHKTGAFLHGAELLFVVDLDDPQIDAYRANIIAAGDGVTAAYCDTWRPLVPKLNHIARALAISGYARALGFAGDDHRPRTPGWALAYKTVLDVAGTGIVYGNDGYQGADLPTQWAMTSDIVKALDAMVPGTVEHLYCDNIVRDLGQQAECLTYLPQVMIEHMHPVVRKVETDEQYERVNSGDQRKRDRRAYREWQNHQQSADVQTVRRLIEGSPS